MTEVNTLIANTQSLTDSVLEALEHNNQELLNNIFLNLEASEIVHLLESIPDSLRGALWEYIPEEFNGEVLVELGDVARISLAKYLDHGQVVDAVSDLDTNDLADVVDTLPDEFGDAIRQSLDFHGLQNLEACLAFDEGTAGRLMETDAIAIRSDVTLEAILRYLRKKETIPEHTMGLMVIDREGLYLGELPLSKLITSSPDKHVSDVMDTEALSVPPEMPQNELAVLFREHDLTSMPVVDENNKLIGRITLDDMIEILDEEADRQILGAVGLDEEEDLFSPVLPSAKRRLFWLGINLATAFLASWVIGLFEGTLEKVVALAVLMPIVASMGGIAGSQTLTLMIRGLAMGKISSSNQRWLAYKEITISIISGIVWAIVVGCISYLWFKDIRISLVLGSAMIINLAVAAVAGFSIPLLMKKAGIDPALAGGVALTTATDVVGFVSFLGLATIFLL